MPPIRDRYVARVRNCARCGQTHTGLEAKRFVRPIFDDDGYDLVFTHWATCPITGDPILIADRPTEPPAHEQDGVLANMHLEDPDDDWPAL